MSFENKGSMAASIVVSREPDRSGNLVCDGVNDEDDFQLANDILYEEHGGGTAIIKEGEYSIGDTITRDSGVWFIGNNPGSVAGATPGAGGTYLSLDADVNMFQDRTGQLNWFGGFKNIHFDLQTRLFRAIWFWGARGATVENCVFIDGGGHVITEIDGDGLIPGAQWKGESNKYLHNYFQNLTVSAQAGARCIYGQRDGEIMGNRFGWMDSYYPQCCVFVEAGGWRIESNHFNQTLDNSVYLQASSQTVVNNYFDYSWQEAIYSSNLAGGHIISGNRFQDISRDGPGAFPTIYLSNAQNCIMTGNRFFGSEGPPSFNIYLANTCQNNLIKDNHHLVYNTAPVYDLNPELNIYASKGYQMWQLFGGATSKVTSPRGVLISGAGNGAIANGEIPIGLEQILYVRYTGVALGDSGANRMLLRPYFASGPDGSAYNTNAFNVADHPSEEETDVDDMVSWIIKDADVANALRAVGGGETVSFLMLYNAIAGSDIASNLVAREATIYYV